ncbi:MAG: GNAT family N-acetyltransferase, partial [Terriglobia bacterium]
QAPAASVPHKLVLADMQPCLQQDNFHEIASDHCFATPPSSSLVNEWSKLAQKVGAPPQQQPGWTWAWWNAFGTGALEIHTIRDNGRLTGVLPMIRQGGTLKAAANIHTPGFGVLADNPRAAGKLAQALFSSEPRRISLIDLEPGGETFRAFMHAAHEASYKVLLRPYQCSPYLEITETWEEYKGVLTAKKRFRNLRRKRLKLSREGNLSMEIVDGSIRLEELLQEAYKVEASSWKGPNGSAIISDPRTRNFYTGIARWAADQGSFRLAFLRLNGRPVAMTYLLEQHGVCHLLKAGYDPDFGRFSPGTLLTHMIIEHCFAAGLDRVEFYGNGERYKFFWANAAIERIRLEAFAPTTTGRLTEAAFVYARPVAVRIMSARRHF